MNAISTTLLVIVVIFLLYRFIGLVIFLKYYLISRLKLRNVRGPPVKNFFIGNTIHLYTTPEGILQCLRKWAAEYYPVYTIGYCLGYSANILSPEDFELILSNPKHIDKSILYTILHRWLKTGLLTSTGAKWHNRRKILTTAFHFNILQQFISTFNEETDQLVGNLKKECANNYDIEVNSHVIKFTLSTMSATSLGAKMRFETGEEENYKQNIIEIGEIFVHSLLHPWLMIQFLYYFTRNYYKEVVLVRKLRKFTGDIIKARKKTFKPIEMEKDDNEIYSKNRKLAMLDLLFNTQMLDGSIDDEGIQEEVDTFMFEGHDTTAVALCYALMLLACNKDCQDKAYQEIVKVLGDPEKKPTYNDLQEFQYLDRCVKEVLRLYPSVHFISREISEDVLLNDGVVLPKRCVVNLHIFDLHHNPKIYPDPEKFDPDRFLPENCRDRHPFAYVPFSAGPRNCIGQRFAMLEMKAVLCGILKNFFLEPIDTPETVVTVADLLLRSKQNIKVKFVLRNDEHFNR